VAVRSLGAQGPSVLTGTSLKQADQCLSTKLVFTVDIAYDQPRLDTILPRCTSWHCPMHHQCWRQRWQSVREEIHQALKQQTHRSAQSVTEIKHTCTPETRAPARTPERVCTPNRVPTIRGVSMTNAPGGIISLMEASVEILTHVA
jgi:hypothetical protein